MNNPDDLDRNISEIYVESICTLEDAQIQIDKIMRKLEENLTTTALSQDEINFIIALKKALSIQSKDDEEAIIRSGIESSLSKLPCFTNSNDSE